MNHALFMGVYAGAISPPPIRARVEQADLIIGLGMFLTDIEMGGSQPPEALRHRSIWAVENRVNVSFHTYTDITLRDFVHALLRAELKRHREKVVYSDNLPATRPLPIVPCGSRTCSARSITFSRGKKSSWWWRSRVIRSSAASTLKSATTAFTSRKASTPPWASPSPERWARKSAPDFAR